MHTIALQWILEIRKNINVRVKRITYSVMSALITKKINDDLVCYIMTFDILLLKIYITFQSVIFDTYIHPEM